MVTEKLTDRWKWTTNASGGVVGASDREYHCNNLESASFPREVIVKDETYSILANRQYRIFWALNADVHR